MWRAVSRIFLSFLLIAWTSYRLNRSAFPLAAIAWIIRHYGGSQAVGYDLGCLLEAVCRNSCLAKDVLDNDVMFYVDGFHGSAHKRVCQVKWTGLYAPESAVGNEDFAGCERFFSQLDRIASSVRYASRYRYKQAMHLVTAQLSEDRYSSLGTSSPYRL
jgi:hypothetical protein